MQVAVLLANMGGPDSLQAVEPFLRQIFSDPHIIDIAMPAFFRRRLARIIARKRSKESLEIYKRLGGKTPLHDNMRRQAEALQLILNADAENDVAFRVLPANRYGRPSLEGVLKDIQGDGYDSILVISMYPFFATSTSGSIASELKRLRSQLHWREGHIQYIDRYGHLPEFLRAQARHIEDQLKKEISQGEKIDVLLSAHSIPRRQHAKGDPYQSEVYYALDELKKQVHPAIRFHLAFQSKIGPVQWLEPSTEEKIAELARRGIKRLFVYPLGFVADNSETVYEIGMLYREWALKQGIQQFIRLNALNDFPPFLQVLANLVRENVKLRRK